MAGCSKDLLTREKELTRLRDEVSRHRRELPWVKVEKEYVFDGPNGKETLADLFDGPQSIDRLSLHAWPRLGGRLQKLFVSGGSFRRRELASATSRRDASW